MENFVILIGGPAQFKGCDKAHDQTWLNYIVPMQIAASKDLYKRRPTEKVHWVVYEPPYEKRWANDSVITKEEKKQSDGYHLHSIRKKAADKIIGKGATDYLNRIQSVAKTNKITYKGIRSPKEFWSYLGSMQKASVTRVWYSGHASGQALMLALTHDAACGPIAYKTDTIEVDDIAKTTAKLSAVFSKSAKQVSKFYGCYTQDFAEKWHKKFGVSSAGAKLKIDFGVIDRASDIINVLERIEKTPTSLGNPDWKEFK